MFGYRPAPPPAAAAPTAAAPLAALVDLLLRAEDTLLRLGGAPGGGPAAAEDRGRLLLLLATVLLAAAGAYVVLARYRPAAYPGDANGKRAQARSPSWPRLGSAARPRPFVVDPGWRYVEGRASHAASVARFRDASLGPGPAARRRAALTGEAAGRQTWQFDAEAAETLGPDLAVHFEPDNNPNSADLLYRRQQLCRPHPGDDIADAAAAGDGGGLTTDGGSGGARGAARGRYGSASSSGPRAAAARAALRATDFYASMQCADGHWAGDYGGPMFLMPGLVVVAYVTGTLDDILPLPHRRAMCTYLRNHQQTDGGWGTHIESASTMFGSTLSYVTLRLLGVPADDPALLHARVFMRAHGGALYTSSWAKFWLAVLGVYDWDGVNSIPPEMWMLPNWFPFHPGKMWCHARMVYLPMCYIYGQRWVYPGARLATGEDEDVPASTYDTVDPLVGQLRAELYDDDDDDDDDDDAKEEDGEEEEEVDRYAAINWDRSRHLVAEIDNYSPVTFAMWLAQNLLSWYEWLKPCGRLRRRGLDFAIEYIHAEDAQTNYVDIGPVNKAMNMLCVFIDAEERARKAAAGEGGDADDEQEEGDVDGRRDPAFLAHALRVDDYLWVAEDGMKMQGYNGSQCWDTSFAARAVTEAKLCPYFPRMVGKMWGFLERTQILSTAVSGGTPAADFETPAQRARYFRHVSRGGWPFSTSAHGWPISDCTAEGLKAVLALRNQPTVLEGVRTGALRGISDQRLFDAVEVVLSMQNDRDGGWATYENTRGGAWYEWLNPSEVFGDIMIDYSYVECTSASLCCLVDFAQQFPDHRGDEIRRAVRRGLNFIRAIQREDGSWYGSWACCFTYGTWFGVEALVHAGTSFDPEGYDPRDDPTVRRAARFLLSKQNENGGWGEDFTSCYDKDYALRGAEEYGEDGSSVVNTAWALLALVSARCEDTAAMSRGAAFLRAMQDSMGDWEQEGIVGVFNRSCGITYTQYRNVFPLWALGRYANYDPAARGGHE